MGITAQKVDGRRITDLPTMEVVSMVYAGLINKKIVASLQSNGVNALGLSGADLNLLPAKKRVHSEIDFGWVGDLNNHSWGENHAIWSLLESEVVPVICSITHDSQGNLLNTNADTIAAQVVKNLSENYEVSFHYCIDFPGVMHDDQVIEEIEEKGMKQLIKSNVVTDGMIPKLETAFKAAKFTKETTIQHWNQLEQHSAGTKIKAS